MVDCKSNALHSWQKQDRISALIVLFYFENGDVEKLTSGDVSLAFCLHESLQHGNLCISSSPLFIEIFIIPWNAASEDDINFLFWLHKTFLLNPFRHGENHFIYQHESVVPFTSSYVLVLSESQTTSYWTQCFEVFFHSTLLCWIKSWLAFRLLTFLNIRQMAVLHDEWTHDGVSFPVVHSQQRNCQDHFFKNCSSTFWSEEYFKNKTDSLSFLNSTFLHSPLKQFDSSYIQ